MSDAETQSPESVPVFQEYMNPLLEVFRSAEGPLENAEVDRRVIAAMALPDTVVAIEHPGRPGLSEVSYRIAWARSYLKQAGLIANPSRGKWGASPSTTTAGVIDAYSVASGVAQTARSRGAEGSDEDIDASDDELDFSLGAASDGPLDPSVAQSIRASHAELVAQDKLLRPENVDRHLRRFAERFGPEVLAGLDGEALLLALHGRENKDSLAYILEFKDNEDEATLYGSISGGSALKFRIYQAAETGQWMSGSAAQLERLSLPEAISIARTQRDQLVAGAQVLLEFRDSSERDYGQLQQRMNAAAAEVAEMAWGHKYFFLLFPSLLLPFHAIDYQRLQLYKLLKFPLRGHYENDGLLMRAATELALTPLDLAQTLYYRSRGFQAYWRIGTVIDDRSEWLRMRDGGWIAIGWDAVGDLSQFDNDAEGRLALRTLVERHYPSTAGSVTKAKRQLTHFASKVREGDLVLAMDGKRVLGLGRVAGRYEFGANDGATAHRRKVDWLSITEWRLPDDEGLRTTFVALKKPANLIEIERRILHLDGATATPSPNASSSNRPSDRKAEFPLPALTGVLARIDSVLQRKQQTVLHGPPGTGKTYWAERAVRELASRAWFQVEASQLGEAQKQELTSERVIETCSFHPAYGYEDFIEGYRAKTTNGALGFELRDGIFKRICSRARKRPDRPFFLLIDEINRGDIPRIFGELLTVMEKEKRGLPITLPVSGEEFSVPGNVFLVGTMNTADRSIALLDAALRRRFAFIELAPDSSTLKGASVGGLPLGPWLDELNGRLVKYLGSDARHLRIGHSYLLSGGQPIRELSLLGEVLRHDIIPLLEEYCYEDPKALVNILGPQLGARTEHGVNNSGSLRDEELVERLLTAFATITATRAAVSAEAVVPDVDDDENAEVANESA